MPGGDKTGPQGKGPLTGKRMGFCTGNKQTDSDDRPGMGRRRWRWANTGRGRGFGRRGNGRFGFRGGQDRTNGND